MIKNWLTLSNGSNSSLRISAYWCRGRRCTISLSNLFFLTLHIGHRTKFKYALHRYPTAISDCNLMIKQDNLFDMSHKTRMWARRFIKHAGRDFRCVRPVFNVKVVFNLLHMLEFMLQRAFLELQKVNLLAICKTCSFWRFNEWHENDLENLARLMELGKCK